MPSRPAKPKEREALGELRSELTVLRAELLQINEAIDDLRGGRKMHRTRPGHKAFRALSDRKKILEDKVSEVVSKMRSILARIQKEEVEDTASLKRGEDDGSFHVGWVGSNFYRDHRRNRKLPGLNEEA